MRRKGTSRKDFVKAYFTRVKLAENKIKKFAEE